jgi:hypothetical protein
MFPTVRIHSRANFKSGSSGIGFDGHILAIDKAATLGQGEVPDKAAYSHLLEFCLGSFAMAAAVADDGHSRLPKQSNGGSDALWEHPLSH